MPRFLFVSLVVLSLGLGACSGCDDDNGVGHLPDAPPPPADAEMIDTPPDTPVTLTITNHGEPMPGVHVYFINPDGSVASTTNTDATGTASAVVVAGGSVTALRPFDLPPGGKVETQELRTFVGVKPGDHLVLTQVVASQSVSFKLEANAVPEASNPFSVTYDVFTTCGTPSNGAITPGGSGAGSGDPAPGGTLSFNACGTTADIAIVASEPVLQLAGLPRAAATTTWLQGVYHAGANLADTPVTLAGDTYDTLNDVTFTYPNTSASTINVRHAPIVTHGPLGPFSGDAVDGTLTLHEAKTPATKAIVDTTLRVGNQHEVVEWGDFTTTYTLDASVLLREVTDGPAFEVDGSQLMWTEATDGAAPDFTLAGILVRRPEPVLTKWHWEIVAPYATGAIKFPRLPTDVFDWTPLDNEVIGIDAIRNVKITGGYDAVRAHALDIQDQTGPLGFVAGASGRAVIVDSGLLPPPGLARRRAARQER